ncbi:MAG: hypothetical protein ACRCXK_05440 [Wohlfahrtiimonas sp.]
MMKIKDVEMSLHEDFHLLDKSIDYIFPRLEKNLYVLEYYLTLIGGEVFESLYPNNPSFKSAKEIFPKMGYISQVYYSYLLTKILERYEYINKAKNSIAHDVDVIAVRDIKTYKTNQEKKALLEQVTRHYIYLPSEDSELQLFQYEYSIFFDSIYPQSAFRSLHSPNAHSDWVRYHRKQENDNTEAVILRSEFLNNIDFKKSFGYEDKRDIFRNPRLYKITSNYRIKPIGDLDIDPYVIMNDSIAVKKLDINDQSYINTHSFAHGLFVGRELRDRNYFTCELSKPLKIPFDDIYLDKEELISLGLIQDNLSVKQRRAEILLRVLKEFPDKLIDSSGYSLYPREKLFGYIFEKGVSELNLTIYEARLFDLTKESIKEFLDGNKQVRVLIQFKKGRPKGQDD